MESIRQSVDTQRAVNALNIMLKRVKKGDFQYSSSTAGQPMDSKSNHPLQKIALTKFPDDIPTQSTGAPAFNQQYSAYVSNIGERESAKPNSDQTPPYNSLGVIEDMLDIPAQLDWVRNPTVSSTTVTNPSFLEPVRQSYIRGPNGHQ
jgi:hypothetical protein